MATARRMAPTGAARRGAPAAAPVSNGYRGAAGIAKMQEEQARQEAQREASSMNAGMPFRFFCPVGETRQIVILDEMPDFFRYEHNLKDARSGKWNIFTACIAENANCPVCRNNERPAYYALFLSILDLTPYVNKDNIEVPWSKKLICIKSQQQKKILRYYERHGTLRGLVLNMTRDSDKDAAIGNDIEEDGFMTEDELGQYVDAYTDSQGKEHEVIGYEAFDYDELFPPVTEESLIAIAGGRAEAGTRAGDRQTLRGDSSGDGWDREPARPAIRRRADEAPARGGPPARGPAPSHGAPPARRAAPPQDDVQDDDQGEDAPAPPARRPLARGPAPARAAAPAARPAPARRTAPVDDAGDDAQDDPPQRTTARAPAARPAPARRAPVAPDPADEPAAPASSLADRRRALRR